MPANHQDLLVKLNGTDGKGQYSGTANSPEDAGTVIPPSLIIWTAGKPKLVAPPAGCSAAGAMRKLAVPDEHMGEPWSLPVNAIRSGVADAGHAATTGG